MSDITFHEGKVFYKDFQPDAKRHRCICDVLLCTAIRFSQNILKILSIICLRIFINKMLSKSPHTF